MAAVGSFAPARVRSDPGNKWPGQLEWHERKGYWGSIGDNTSREGELVVRPPMEDGGSAPAREGRTSGLYRRGSALARRFTSWSRATSWHGRGMGIERRQRAAMYGGDAVGRATTVGVAWPMRARHVGQGDGAGMAVRRRGSHDARTSEQRPASACRPSGGAADARRRRGRRALERQEPKTA
jgi:hypothetical protein